MYEAGARGTAPAFFEKAFYFWQNHYFCAIKPRNDENPHPQRSQPQPLGQKRA